MKKTDFALESFKNIQDLIKFIDQKSSLVLVVSGLIFTGYIEFIKDLIFISPRDSNFWSILTFLSSLSTLICLTLVLYISIFKILKPQKAKHYGVSDKSLFYYEHLASIGKEQVLAEYDSISEDKMLKEIIDQQHEVSVILNTKQNEFGKSLIFLFVSMISIIIFILSSFQL